jgi:hypothetical protein
VLSSRGTLRNNYELGKLTPTLMKIGRERWLNRQIEIRDSIAKPTYWSRAGAVGGVDEGAFLLSNDRNAILMIKMLPYRAARLQM